MRKFFSKIVAVIFGFIALVFAKASNALVTYAPSPDAFGVTTDGSRAVVLTEFISEYLGWVIFISLFAIIGLISTIVFLIRLVNKRVKKTVGKEQNK